MTNYTFSMVVNTLKKWNIEKETARKVYLAVTLGETLVYKMNAPSLYTYLDLVESLSILAGNQEVSLITTTGARREVEITNKDMLLWLIMNWLDGEYLRRENIDQINSETEDIVQERIQFLIDEGRKWQEVYNALEGRNRNGGWVPLMGCLAENIESILVGDNVEFKNKSKRYALIFDILLIFHYREEDTDNKKMKAVMNWMKSYDNLTQEVKIKMCETLCKERGPEVKENLANIFNIFFDGLWDWNNRIE